MKKLIHTIVAVALILTPLLAQPVSAARWNRSGTFVIAEPSPAGTMLAARDPDELPIIPAPGKPERKQGDADGNGKINYVDALLILRHSIGLEELSEATVALCDVDKNGKLNYVDALMVLRYSIGLIEHFS